MARGFFTAATSSSGVWQGTSRSASGPARAIASSVLSTLRLYSATLKPFSAMLKARFRPMTAKPTTAISAPLI